MMSARGPVGLVIWGIGLMLASSGSAFGLTGHDWSYQATRKGEDWIVCRTAERRAADKGSIAAGEVQRALTPDDSAGRDAIYGSATGWALMPGGGFTPSTPAATALDGKLGLFGRGTDDRTSVNFTLTGP